MPNAAEVRELAEPDTNNGFLTVGKAETSPGPAATFPPAHRRVKEKGKKEKNPRKSQGNQGQPQKCWVAASQPRSGPMGLAPSWALISSGGVFGP